ncbi:benzoate 4-monooxygenase cytochrome P450 protein [Rutstroemia sp. NJR-2017a WRK4]|nr:benzoate 4-monooxygenase cytochrome P450 protein [Rutstroemia sp. NJR-2017a WRK4]
MQAGDLVHDIHKIHEKYGSIVRVAPNEVSFVDSRACKDIYGQRSGHKPFPKNPVWVPPPSERAPSILNANNDDHYRIRRAWAHGFTDKALKDQEPLVKSHIDTLIRRLHEQVDKSKGYTDLDLVKWYNFTTFDIIGDLAFGESFGCLEKTEYHSWVALIVFHFKAAVISASFRFYPWLFKLLMMSVPKATLQKQRDHFSNAAEKVQHRLNVRKDRPDFLSHFSHGKQALSEAEIESTAAIIIMAGSNSLATTLASTTNHLTKYPKTLERLTNEIRSSFKDESDMNLESLVKLPYLSAVIEEGLCITCPVPLGMARVVPEGGDTVCGEFLPAGTCVSYMQYGANHSSKNFHQPNEFIPERWLEDPQPSSLFVNDKKEAHQPFSVGPRSCLGYKLAYLELRLILAKMIWNFDISRPGGPDSGLDWTSQKTYAVWVREPFIARLSPAHTSISVGDQKCR